MVTLTSLLCTYESYVLLVGPCPSSFSYFWIDLHDEVIIPLEGEVNDGCTLKERLLNCSFDLASWVHEIFTRDRSVRPYYRSIDNFF